MGKWIDLSGERFGRLLPQEYLGGSKWTCLCDCGKVTIVRTRDLRSGNTTSCGCSHYGYSSAQSFIGMRFGKLVVKEVVPNSGASGHVKCVCLCDCGNEYTALLSQLRRNKVVSCGCYKALFASSKYVMRKKAYEEYYKSSVPEDYSVISLDGDTLNFAPENLMIVKKNIAKRLRKDGFLGDRENARTAVLSYELAYKITELEKIRT